MVIKTQNYDAKFWKNFFKSYDYLNFLIPYNEVLELLVNEIKLFDGVAILEIGCGTGNLVKKISCKLKNIRDHKMIGLDASELAISIAKEKVSNSKINSIFIKSDLADPIRIDAGSLDYVVSNNVLYTLDSKVTEKVLHEVHRCLKPSGIFILSELNKNFNPFRIYKYHIRKSFSGIGVLRTLHMMLKMSIPTVKIFYHNALIKKHNINGEYHFFSDKELSSLLTMHGFKIVVPERESYAGSAYFLKAMKE